MKKVLFATTALVATAGVAAADVTFGGLGRFGFDYNDNRTSDEFRLTSRIRLIVTGSAESDNGLSFGAQIRYQANGEAQGAAGGTAGFNMPRFWVTSGGLTLSAGNVLGAIDSMPSMYTGTIGLTGLGFANVVYMGADVYSSGSLGRYGADLIWSGGNWGVHLSYTGFDYSTAADDRLALAGSYTAGNYTVALGLQDSDNADDTEWALTLGGTFGNWDLSLNYADNGTLEEKFGIGFNYQATATTWIRGYLNQDNGDTAYDTSGQNYGIGFHHRMGGGTFLEGGIANVRDYGVATDDAVRADLGLRFTF